MRIEFDRAKDRQNFAKHGVSLVFAIRLEWDDALVWVDERFSYDELRMTGLAPAGNALYCVTFIDHGSVYRIISLRPASKHEHRHYVENYP